MLFRSTVYPGPIKTAMADTALLAYDKAPAIMPSGTTDSLARRVLAAVQKRRARVIYPNTYRLARMFPGLSRWVTDAMAPPLKR